LSRLRKLAALLLVALWLPATLHCQLEGLGLDAIFACADDAAEAAHSNDECTDDGCQTIESGQVTLSKMRVDVASLALFAGSDAFCLFEIPAPAPAGEISASRQDETLPLQRTWQFDRRAALPARAPGLNA
jgi:hypothetical protein